MDLPSLLAAYIIGQGSHTGGHFYQANNPDNPMRDVPISLDARSLTEDFGTNNQGRFPDMWSPPRPDSKYKDSYMTHQEYLDDRNRKASDVHGAGFAMQDRMRSMIDNPELKGQVSLVNALLKAGYVGGVADRMAARMIPGGDIGGMERTSGNKYVKPLLGATIATDLLGAFNPKKKWDLNFITADGAPGLMFNKRW